MILHKCDGGLIEMDKNGKSGTCVICDKRIYDVVEYKNFKPKFSDEVRYVDEKM